MISSTNEKTMDWVQQRSVRRFPENNSSININNNNSLKPEKQQHHSWSARDNEKSDRKIQSLLSSSLMNSSNMRTSDSDSPTNNVFQKSLLPNSASETAGEDGGLNHTFNFRSQTKTINKVSISSITKETETTTSSVVQNTATTVDSEQNKDNFVQVVLESGEYLHKFNSWHEFRGIEEIKKCSRKVIERNENIWELVSIEYSHFKLLVNIRDVYCKSYPYLEVCTGQSNIGRSCSSTRSECSETGRSNSISEHKERPNNVFESIDTLLPGIDKLIEYHAKICSCLINNHIIRPDRVITEIGSVLHESIPDDFIPALAELYGRINYTKQYINQKLSQFKKYPVFLSYIHKCERDPKCDKKTLADILLHISIHWSKKVTTLNSIIVNTINDSHDLNNLMKFKEKIDRIVNEASNVMDDQMNSKLLLSLVENYEICSEVEDSDRVFKFMTAENAKLIYNGKVQFELKKSSNGKQLLREVHGVALEECIFFLQAINEPGKTNPKYQLFQERDSAFPALLEWGKLYGYFREEDSKNSDFFSFYVIIEKPGPSIKRLFVGTPQDRSYWKKCMMQGFARWQTETSDIKEADIQLNDDLKNIEKKWANTQFGIELIKNMDNTLKVQLEYRTVGFRCILEEELKRMHLGNSLIKRNSSNSITTVTDNDVKKDDIDSTKPLSTETFLPDLTTRDGIHDWLETFMEWVNRLKFSLCSNGANITRSASEIEARKRPSIPTVKKCDTFSSRDSPTYEKRQTDVTFLNPPINKQKKDQRRISVTGFTNLFRMNSKSVKYDENDKTHEVPNVSETTADVDKDSSTISNLEMISETDCFLSGLSKDTVTAFNEINLAAKNITIELLNLRTQNTILEAEVKKLQEENQSFRDFLMKYQKSAGENQSGMVMSSTSQQKSDAVNNSVGSLLLSATGSTDLIAEGLETLNENSSGFAHTNQKMVECRRQTENLRQMYDLFAKEKKKWEKEYESQRRKIENDKESIFQKNCDLQKEKDNLVEREKKYKENCVSLQKKIDMYFESYGVNLDDEQPQHHEEGHLISNAKLQQILQMQPHCRSHSDDISHKRMSKPPTSSSGPISPPLASTEATSYIINQNISGISNPIHNSSIPDQLRGSLINQERQSLKTNSSDNILETRGKVANPTVPKTKMTPSIDRKEMYSSSNMCFSGDDKDDRDCSSDVDDLYCGPSSNVRSSTFDIVQTRKSITSVISKTISISDSTKSVVRNPTVSSTTLSDTISGNKPSPPTLGIPLALAAKTKVKKEKSRKFKII